MKAKFIRILRATLALGTVVAIRAATPAPSTDVAIKDAVLATNAAMIAAADRLDTEAFFGFFADGATPVVQNGAIFRTRQEAKEAVDRGLRGIVKIERRIDRPEVTVLGPDAALLVGEGTVNATAEDGRVMTSVFSVSLVFVRRGSDWKLLHGHYSAPQRM